MTANRRQVLELVAVALLSLSLQGVGLAQTYPSRPLRIVVMFPPGSSADIAARTLGSRLTEQLAQPIIIDNRPGGTGIIAVEFAKNAAPDGYTLLMTGVTAFSLLPALKAKLSYDPDKDFIPLSRIASVNNVVAVHPSLGVSSVAALVSLAKAHPGELNFGSSGNGSGQHLAGALFNLLAHVRTVHVPYKGSVLALNELISGQIQFIVTSPLIVMPHARSGRLRVIATTGAKRDPLLPELATVAEVLPGYEITQWSGVAVPAKTPAAVVSTLHTEIVKALKTAQVREQFAKQGATPHADTPAEFAAFVKADRERIARIGRQAGITID